MQLCCFGADGDKFMPLSENSVYFKDMAEAIGRFDSNSAVVIW
ncbi:hypothetical protein JCM19236_4708 [Vibrio sp. JCM 19236]|nr:hypothetical protein JCM19236_4708 [Vibrio sp. JCM 19236]